MIADGFLNDKRCRDVQITSMTAPHAFPRMRNNLCTLVMLSIFDVRYFRVKLGAYDTIQGASF